MVMKKKETVYRKIPLIRPGRIYGQRTYSIGLYSGWGGGAGAYIWEEKQVNLQLVTLTFLSFFPFFQYKARISAFFTLWNM